MDCWFTAEVGGAVEGAPCGEEENIGGKAGSAPAFVSVPTTGDPRSVPIVASVRSNIFFSAVVVDGVADGVLDGMNESTMDVGAELGVVVVGGLEEREVGFPKLKSS
jgi:hypothetical protein